MSSREPTVLHNFKVVINSTPGLSYISLAERICGLPDLKFLYPDLPKCQMFGKYVQVHFFK